MCKPVLLPSPPTASQTTGSQLSSCNSTFTHSREAASGRVTLCIQQLCAVIKRLDEM